MPAPPRWIGSAIAAGRRRAGDGVPAARSTCSTEMVLLRLGVLAGDSFCESVYK